MTLAALLLKAPHVGKVKTRLARSIGSARAADVYRALVEHQLTQIPNDWHTAVHYAPPQAESEMRAWLKPFLLNEHEFVAQPNGDLGVRLLAAMDHGFASGAECVFFLGGDCPGLTQIYLEEAKTSLKEKDMVIAPAVDGGYVLLGLRKPVTSIFEKIPWSSVTVFETTLQRARVARLAFHCLPPLEDVDDLRSYERQCATTEVLRQADQN